MNPYKYTNKLTEFNLQPEKKNGRWEKAVLTFPVVSENQYSEAGFASADYYTPLSSGKKPCVILVHGWGDRSVLPFIKMAGDLAKHDIVAIVLYLPFHSKRAPKYIRRKGTHLSKEEWYTCYQMAITDIFHLTDWLETRTEVDNSRIGIIGLSLGAFMSAIAMAVDERFKAGVLMVGGGNAGKVSQFSRFSVFRKEYAVSQQQYEQDQRTYYDFISRAKINGWDNIDPEKKEFLNDPLTFAYILKGKPILMINALWDEFVPREATEEFWRATGEQDLVWIRSTHATIWAFYPRIFKQVNTFLRTNLIK